VRDADAADPRGLVDDRPLDELTGQVEGDRQGLRLLVLTEDGRYGRRGVRDRPATGLLSAALPDDRGRRVRGTAVVTATFRSVVTHTFASPLLGVQTARPDCNGPITASENDADNLWTNFVGSTLS
jgi:hypothetical protein